MPQLGAPTTAVLPDPPGVSVTVLVEANGAQVLPRARDQRATVPAYAAWLACGADQRRHPEWADLAARLYVRRRTT